MYHAALTFLACILAGFALLKIPSITLIVGLMPFIKIIAVLAIIIFALALLYIGFKTLFSSSWR